MMDGSKEQKIEDLERVHKQYLEGMDKAAAMIPPEDEQRTTAAAAFSPEDSEGKAQAVQRELVIIEGIMRSVNELGEFIQQVDASGLSLEELPEEIRKDWEEAKALFDEMQGIGFLHILTPEEARARDQERATLEKLFDAVQDAEKDRPEYSPEDLDSVTKFSNWNNRRIVRLQDLNAELKKALEIFRNDNGSEPPELEHIVKETAEKLDSAKAEGREAWDKYAQKQKEQEEARQEEERKREEIRTAPELSQLPTISKYGVMNDRLNKQYLTTAPNSSIVDGIHYLTWAVNQAPSDREPVPTSFMLSLGENKEITASSRLDAEDDNIIMAIANIIYRQQKNGIPGPWSITPEEIWRTKKGISGQHTAPPPKEKEDLCRRIDKMRLVNVKIDVEAELNAGYIDKTKGKDLVTDGKIEDNCIHATKGHAKTKRGRIVDVYIFYAIPVIYSYNQIKGHLVLVDYSLLNTSDTTKNDKEGLTDRFRLYLLREILQMYTGHRDSTKIYFATMYKATGTKTPEERAAEVEHKKGTDQEAAEKSRRAIARRYGKEDREKVEELLRSWESKSRKVKLISSHNLIKDGKKIIGVDVNLNPKYKEATEQKQVTKKD